MTHTQPLAGTGDESDKAAIRQVINERRLVGAANDSKWQQLLDSIRLREGWHPSYRYKCVDGKLSSWDCEWWYHLPFPMMSVEWLDICVVQESGRGGLVTPELIDHSDWIVGILDNARFSYDSFGELVRIYGYLPKSLEALDRECDPNHRT